MTHYAPTPTWRRLFLIPRRCHSCGRVIWLRHGMTQLLPRFVYRDYHLGCPTED